MGWTYTFLNRCLSNLSIQPSLTCSTSIEAYSLIESKKSIERVCHEGWNDLLAIDDCPEVLVGCPLDWHEAFPGFCYAPFNYRGKLLYSIKGDAPKY